MTRQENFSFDRIADLPGARSPRLSAVVPCYNEAENLRELHRRLAAACAGCVGGDYEIVLVNDGSTDGTWSAIRDLARGDAAVVGVNLSRNHGHQLALTAGLSVARGKRILIIDADLQDPPELLPAMMRRLDDGVDVAYGQRASRAGETWFKKATAAGFYRLLRQLIDVEIPVDTGDFRLMSRRALDVLNRMPEHHRFIRGMVAWIGLRQEPVHYDRAARFAGETKYPLKRMVRFAFDAITSFSVQPLRVASYLGTMLGLLSLLLLAYVLIGWLRGATVEGWTSLMVVVVTLSSAQLFVLGILGEYLGRLYIETKRRPLFIIEEVFRDEREAEVGEAQPRAVESAAAVP